MNITRRLYDIDINFERLRRQRDTSKAKSNQYIVYASWLLENTDLLWRPCMAIFE